MDTIFLIMGLTGSFCCVLMYFLLEQGKIDPKGMKFYGINGLGAFLILIAAAHEFDMGDMGSISLEFIWVVISLMGMWKARRIARAAP